MNEHSGSGMRTSPEQMSRKHVFAINRSAEFLYVIRELLQDESYNVTTTNFLPLSFESIAAAKPSLLVVDLVHGEEAGWDLLAQLHEAASTQNIPILLMSTSQDLLEQAKETHAQFGGDRYLTKPFDLDDLLTIVRELIGSA